MEWDMQDRIRAGGNGDRLRNGGESRRGDGQPVDTNGSLRQLKFAVRSALGCQGQGGVCPFETHMCISNRPVPWIVNDAVDSGKDCCPGQQGCDKKKSSQNREKAHREADLSSRVS